jgi:hypothetical protein
MREMHQYMVPVYIVLLVQSPKEKIKCPDGVLEFLLWLSSVDL